LKSRRTTNSHSQRIQAKELYEFLKTGKNAGWMTHDRELVLVYNELKKLFDYWYPMKKYRIKKETYNDTNKVFSTREIFVLVVQYLFSS